MSNGNWSAPLGTLPVGTYTALAMQSDDVGNSGAGAPVTFSLSALPPPTASFTWFPTAPHVGEPVSLVSTSTDPAGAIVGYSWSPAGTGTFTPGAQTIKTSFAKPGNHVVQLRVTDQNGASSSVSETIPVTSVPVSLMQPFPVVRIAGSEGSAGVKIKLLSVQAPIGAKVTIACKGKGCPAKLVSALAAASKGKHAPGSALITFKRFERLLPPGVTLEIKVSKAGQIGKFTRFVSRKHKLPTRSDSCLSPLGKPLTCPSS
jgi:PKD repeat protein